MREILRPGMTVLDVGANVGWYTLHFADLVGPQGHVVAFEPNPQLQLLLELSPGGMDPRAMLEALTDRGYALLQMEQTGELRPRAVDVLLRGGPCDLLARPGG